MVKAKTKTTNKTAKLIKIPKYQSVTASIVIIAAAILGYFLFNAGHAAGPYVSTEAENGQLDSGGVAQVVSGDSTASNNTYVRFGALPSSSGGSGGGSDPSGVPMPTSPPAGYSTVFTDDLLGQLLALIGILILGNQGRTTVVGGIRFMLLSVTECL